MKLSPNLAIERQKKAGGKDGEKKTKFPWPNRKMVGFDTRESNHVNEKQRSLIRSLFNGDRS